LKKRSRKLISILLTLALLATLLVPMATPAAASATYSVSNVPTLAPSVKGGTTVQGNPATLGTLTINLDSASVTSAAYTRYVYLELPSDFKFMTGDNRDLPAGVIDSAYASFPGPAADYAFDSYGNGANQDVFITAENGGNRLKVEIGSSTNATINFLKPGVIILQNLKLYVPSGAADGMVQITTIAPSSSVFTSGQKFDVAKIGASAVKVFVSSPSTIGPDGDWVTLYVQEASAGAMKAGAASALKFTLPAGFTWDDLATTHGTPATPATSEVYWNGGNAGIVGATVVAQVYRSNGNRDLVINNAGNAFNGSYFKLKVWVTPDTLTANKGDVEISLGGDSTYTPSNLIIGTYGDFGQKLSADTAPEIKAGKYGQKIGNIVITEDLKGSLFSGRSVTLTLPSGARWSKAPNLATDLSTTGGLNAPVTVTSTDARSIKITTTGTSTDKAKLVYKDGEVITAADFSGDLKLTTSGSLGFSGDITVAKVKPAVTASIASVNEVKIGVGAQSIGDITIEEFAKEVFASSTKPMDVNVTAGGLVGQPNVATLSGTLTITAPSGVTFAAMPTVSVDGNVDVDMASTSATLTSNKSVITVPIKSTSTKPSKIILKDVKLDVNRTVSEGDLKLGVGGYALIDDVQSGITDRLFEPARYAAEITAAKVVTPAPGDTKSNASFVIGKTTYSVAGVEKTMDVAPYVKNGRTYLPVRYVASALGVLDSNILWDEATQKVTLLKGDKVVQLTIGSNAMIVNGVTITMDAAPEITSGRTMLPFRFIAQAMGSSVAWDEATQTVTLN